MGRKNAIPVMMEYEANREEDGLPQEKAKTSGNDGMRNEARTRPGNDGIGNESRRRQEIPEMSENETRKDPEIMEYEANREEGGQIPTCPNMK